MIRPRVAAVCGLLALTLAGGAVATAQANPDPKQPPHSATTGPPSDGKGDAKHPAARGNSAADLNTTVLWSEDFDGVASATGFTHRAPEGWAIDSSGFTTGEQRWAGWAFSNIRDWTWAVGTDRRHWFTGAHNTFAVVESEHQRLAPRDRMTTSLTTPAIRVTGKNRDLQLRFDSHYAQGAAPQHATVTASFDGGSPVELVRYTEDVLSAHERFAVTVPAKAKTVQFAFTFAEGHNDKWWAIDNVELVQPLAEPSGAPIATFDVLSDIHAPRGNAKYPRALQVLTEQQDKAGALILNGDVTELGQAADYASATELLATNPHPSGVTLIGAGNHEYLGRESFEAYHERFLALAGRDVPWGEVVVNGVPALMISTEYYSDVDRRGVEPYVQLGDEQLTWLGSRLEHYAKQGTPVLLFNHHPLPQSVSFTHSAWYGNDFYDLEALNEVIAAYPNIVYFSGHTHAWLGLNDWFGRYRVNGSGNPEGFPAVNTGAILNAGVPDGDHDETRLDGEHTTGLRVKVYRDRVRVEAWDFEAKAMMDVEDFAVTKQFGKRGR